MIINAMAIGTFRINLPAVLLATIVVFANQVFAQEDLIILDFTVTTPAPDSGNTSFESGSPTDTTMFVELYNSGVDIDASSDPLFVFNLSLATDLANTNANYMSLDFSDTDYSNMGEAIANKGNPTFNPLANITIPLATCETYTHLCLSIGSYPYGDTNYDVNCIEFGNGALLAGIKDCRADVYATSMEITYPTSHTYTANEVNEINTTISIANQGSDLSAANSGYENFNFTCYISNATDIDSSDTQYLDFEADLTWASNLDAALATGDTLTVKGVACQIIIPSDQCDRYEYLCVGVTASASNYTAYSDADSTNDYVCLAFGEISEGYAGVLDCPDITTLEYEITGQNRLTYDLNTYNEINFAAKVANNGTIDIPAASSGDNYDFTCTLTDNADLDDDDARTASFDAVTSSDTTNLDDGIEGNSYIEIENVQCNIYINSSYCDIYTHLCVSVGVASDADYSDANTENNYYCLEFGDLSSGKAGVLSCSAGCTVTINILVFFAAALLTQIFGKN